MSSLFVNIIDLDEANGHVTCSLQTAIVLFTCQYIKAPVILVISEKTEDRHNVLMFSVLYLSYKVILESDLPRPASNCLLPVFQSDSGYYCTAGFCSSLRMVCFDRIIESNLHHFKIMFLIYFLAHKEY